MIYFKLGLVILSIPEEKEPAATSIQTNMPDEVEIRHEAEMRGGFAQLAKKGTVRFTSFLEF